MTCDPEEKHKPRAYFSIDQAQSGLSIIIDFMTRWCAEVTFEESRAHLGVQTQRQWSDQAIERMTPCLLGLYSLVALLGHHLHPTGDIPFQQTAWYRSPLDWDIGGALLPLLHAAFAEKSIQRQHKLGSLCR